MKRIALQFTPYSWTDFDWRPLSSLRRWLCMLGVIAIVSTGSVVYTYSKIYIHLYHTHSYDKYWYWIIHWITYRYIFNEYFTNLIVIALFKKWYFVHLLISYGNFGNRIKFIQMMSCVYLWYDKCHITFCFHSLFSVFNCWVEYILPEVCVVASPRALPQSNASGFLPFYGGSSHERNIPISGWSVSRKLSDMQYTGTPFPSNLL